MEVKSLEEPRTELDKKDDSDKESAKSSEEEVHESRSSMNKDSQN